MATERLDLPDEQWADIERRPSHGTIRKISRDTERKSRQDPLAGEDVLVSNLVKDWHVLDEDGNTVPLRSDSYDRVPQDILSLIADECLAVLEAAYPNRAREM